jgi:hypothetical protein
MPPLGICCICRICSPVRFGVNPFPLANTVSMGTACGRRLTLVLLLITLNAHVVQL